MIRNFYKKDAPLRVGEISSHDVMGQLSSVRKQSGRMQVTTYRVPGLAGHLKVVVKPFNRTAPEPPFGGSCIKQTRRKLTQELRAGHLPAADSGDDHRNANTSSAGRGGRADPDDRAVRAVQKASGRGRPMERIPRDPRGGAGELPPRCGLEREKMAADTAGDPRLGPPPACCNAELAYRRR